MADIDKILGEAQKAQEEAEAAARRAQELATQAQAARQRVAQEEETKRRAWAQGVIASYDADLAAADQALEDASTRFQSVAIDEPAAAIPAYLAWAEAAIEHYTLQVRAAAVAPVVDMEATPAESVPPPPFSQALDAALDRRVAALSAKARDDAAAEIAAHLDPAHPATAPVPDALIN
ncbi:MAG: hypothetical protein AVDCRST_MAG19-958 [uncultured Thermomicrobiales bacterium]|uniref:Uncharacterized protein n=1 Tax=uncultured Thermomicrobiales bacterium TaxID=1645740 RepID=A0A6J4UJJ7_9BACT|nr:MAG: hypothetical protein AVDCRST_MAG19-958 [uncultured Thermomicrobiales bacterium]